MLRRITLATALVVFGFAALTLFLQPINSLTYRSLLLAAAALFGFSLLIAIWRWRIPRWIFLFLIAAVTIFLLLPGYSLQHNGKLKWAYLRALTQYADTPYVWGGEGRLGIDCSGLPRRALCDALLIQGLKSANPRAVREAIKLWWNDASARSLAAGYLDQTRSTGMTGVLKDLASQEIPAGAIAITSSGTHCLVHLGNSVWIQADPGVGHVAIFDGRATENPWFSSPVTIYYWNILGNLSLPRA